MKKFYPASVLIVMLMLVSCTASKYTVTQDDGKNIIVGNISWEGWQEHAGWKTYSAGAFTPSQKRVSDVSEITNSKNISYLIFAGSWCGDSEEELPKLYKLLTMSGIFDDKRVLYGLDRHKQEPTGIALQYKIEKVPTLVILSGNEEIGRIVETPKKSWDDDILNIIRNVYYKEE